MDFNYLCLTYLVLGVLPVKKNWQRSAIVISLYFHQMAEPYFN